ncbi:MAG: DUF4215 domain-containing protein [Kofleriaceae bacterium]
MGTGCAALAVLGAVVLAGCLDGTLPRCGELTCAPEQVCAPSTNACVDPAQLDACAGQDDGAGCDLGAAGTGSCRAGVCVITRCGDGVVDPGEVCDDGNQTSGDGCRFDCRSEETCGNGELDPARGEVCDDGNLLDGDGCQASCQLARCGDGVLDLALDEACDDGNRLDGDGCASDCASDETCGNGVRDPGEECDDGGLLDHDGCQSTCVLQRCGDGIVDPGLEVCDDGNLVPGDGCAPDCRSDETCGNGTLDFVVGETCDDGNRRGLDGCAASCRVEAGAWRLEGWTLPQRRSGAAMAYDAARAVLVMFGGRRLAAPEAYLDYNETWEFDGATWRRSVSGAPPPARYRHAMSYDAGARAVVMFGGLTSNDGPLDDTWRYDGVSWALVPSATRPAARSDAAMAYDAAARRTILVGGTSAGGTLADAWSLATDGVRWQALAPLPAARTRASAAYDPRRDEVVVVGGSDGAAAATETWLLRGAAWTVVPTAPPAVVARAAFFELEPGMVTAVAPDFVSWRFDGAAWTADAPVGGVGSLDGAAVAVDLARAEVVTYGSGTTGSQAMWRRSGASWAQATAPVLPMGRPFAASAYDARRGVMVVVFEGATGQPSHTWEFDGARWRDATAAIAPSSRRIPAMAYDDARARVVLFGGADSGELDDTWTYDGTSWTELAPGVAPSARSGHAMAYDVGRDAVVLVGGSSGGDETWALDDDGWRRLTDVGALPAATGLGLALDRRRDVLVAAGGTLPAGAVWELGAGSWTEVEVSLGPSRGPMVLEPRSQRPFTYGGQSDGGSATDTWILDGNTWMLEAGSTSPGVRFEHVLGVVGRAGRVVTGFGRSTAILSDVWTWGWVPQTRVEACDAGVDIDGDGLVGCADDDCWASCDPTCPPDAVVCFADGPRCGDGTCDPLETCRSCPDDCAVGSPVCPVRCGDFLCDAPGEDAASCPGDCAP